MSEDGAALLVQAGGAARAQDVPPVAELGGAAGPHLGHGVGARSEQRVERRSHDDKFQLVMQAGAIAKGGEIFILDMGEPVKILDLAKRLIKLSGFEPGKDIEIKITGLRPGEKLYEELLLNMENASSTEYRKIFIEKPIKHDYAKLVEDLDSLKKIIEHDDKLSIIKALQEIIPNYEIGRAHV